MIDVLVQGRLHRAAQQRTSKTGSPFVTATVRVPTKDGTSIFVSVIAFSESAVTALLALEDGDAVALAGELTPKVYTPRDGGEPRPSLDLLAHAVLSPYHVKRRREAIAGERDERQPEQSTEPAAAPAHEEQSDDTIPF